MRFEEKQTEIIKDICPFYKEYGSCEQCDTDLDIDDEPCYFGCIANVIVNNDYRKQSKAAWVWNPNGVDWGLGAWVCSSCGCKNDNLPMDENIVPIRWAGSKFCPNCGACMRDGE